MNEPRCTCGHYEISHRWEGIVDSCRVAGCACMLYESPFLDVIPVLQKRVIDKMTHSAAEMGMIPSEFIALYLQAMATETRRVTR